MVLGAGQPVYSRQPSLTRMPPPQSKLKSGACVTKKPTSGLTLHFLGVGTSSVTATEGRSRASRKEIVCIGLCASCQAMQMLAPMAGGTNVH